MKTNFKGSADATEQPGKERGEDKDKNAWKNAAIANLIERAFKVSTSSLPSSTLDANKTRPMYRREWSDKFFKKEGGKRRRRNEKVRKMISGSRHSTNSRETAFRNDRPPQLLRYSLVMIASEVRRGGTAQAARQKTCRLWLARSLSSQKTLSRTIRITCYVTACGPYHVTATVSPLYHLSNGSIPLADRLRNWFSRNVSVPYFLRPDVDIRKEFAK